MRDYIITLTVEDEATMDAVKGLLAQALSAHDYIIIHDLYPDINPFISAMKAELARHDREKGKTWLTQDEVKIRGEGPGGETWWRVSMEEWLDALLRNAVEEYWGLINQEAKADQEVDISNIMALTWMRRRLK